MPTRSLQSASKGLLKVPNYNLESYGKRAFSVAGPLLCNSTEEKFLLEKCRVSKAVTTADVSAKGGPAFYAVELNSFLFFLFEVVFYCKSTPKKAQKYKIR